LIGGLFDPCGETGDDHELLSGRPDVHALPSQPTEVPPWACVIRKVIVRRQISPIALAVALGLLVGLSAQAGAATNPFGSKSPAQILARTSAAMTKAGSVHLVNRSSLGGTVPFTLTTDSSTSKGAQTEAFGGGVEKVRLIGTTLFIYADATAFSLDFNVSNSSLANQWVRVPSSNANYSNISDAVLLPSLIENTVRMKSLKDLGLKKFQGQEAVAIKGSPPDTTPGTSETQTVYISTAAPYLPIGLKTAFLEGVNGSGTSLFSKWGEKVNVASPSPYVIATTSNFP
jgi:hypothetical protein